MTLHYFDFYFETYFEHKKWPDCVRVAPFSSILSAKVLTSSTTVNSTRFKDVNFVKLILDITSMISEAFCNNKKKVDHHTKLERIIVTKTKHENSLKSLNSLAQTSALAGKYNQ